MMLVVVKLKRAMGSDPGTYYKFYNDLKTKLQFAAGDVAFCELISFTEILFPPQNFLSSTLLLVYTLFDPFSRSVIICNSKPFNILKGSYHFIPPPPKKYSILYT